jgi:rhodanese-related sulfurtransferase
MKTKKYVCSAMLGFLLVLTSAIAGAQETGYADELVDFGILPIDFPRSRAQGYGAPTPTTIPGAQVITTQALMEMRAGRPKPVIFVAYNAKSVIPGAIVADGAGEERLLGLDLEKFTRLLARETQDDKTRPVIFYCHGAKCWLSYNASLHAKEAGYTNVFWYRGGRDAWKAAGKKLQKLKSEDAAEE